MANFWKKVEKVAGVVIGIAGFIAKARHRGIRPAPRSRPGPAGGGGVWFVGTGQTKKPGSWSSGRHK